MNAHRFLINHKSIREWAYFVKGDPKRKLKSDLSWGLGGALLFFAIVGIAYDLRILLWAFAVLFFFAVTWHAIALGDKGNSGSLIVKCDSGVFQSRYGQSKVLAGSINEVIFVFTKKLDPDAFLDEFIFVKLDVGDWILVNHNSHQGDESSESFAKSLATTLQCKFSVIEASTKKQCVEMELKKFADMC